MNNDKLLLSLYNAHTIEFNENITDIKNDSIHVDDRIHVATLQKILNLNLNNKDCYIHITCANYKASIKKHGLWSEETLDENPQRRTIDKPDEPEPEPEPDEPERQIIDKPGYSEYLHDLNEINDLFNELDSIGGTLRRKQKNKNKSRVKKIKSNRRTRRRY
jgi:hypothetical protein